MSYHIIVINYQWVGLYDSTPEWCGDSPFDVYMLRSTPEL